MSALIRQTDFLPAEPTWDSARSWLDRATQFEKGKLYCQIFLGFELLALHLRLGVKAGRPHSPQLGGNTPEGDKVGWYDLLEQHLGVPHTSADRYMDMARAAAEKKLKYLAELRGMDLSTTPIHLLPAPQQEALSHAVKRISDQRTQRDFLEDMGLADSAAEARAKGGDNEWKKWVKNKHPELLNDLGIVPRRSLVKREHKDIFKEWEQHQADLEQKRKDAMPTLSQKEAAADARIAESVLRLSREAGDDIAGLCPEKTLSHWKQALLGALDYLKEIEKARRIKL